MIFENIFSKAKENHLTAPSPIVTFMNRTFPARLRHNEELAKETIKINNEIAINRGRPGTMNIMDWFESNPLGSSVGLHLDLCRMGWERPVEASRGHCPRRELDPTQRAEAIQEIFWSTP